MVNTQSGADSIGRNIEVQLTELDAQVQGYVGAEELAEGGGTSPGPSSSAGCSGAQHACTAVKQLLQQGQVQEAVSIVKDTCPAILEDQRLVFRLRKQHFIELLKHGNAEADKSALACARNELAPLALHAYPEAYLDFKRLLLLLVFERSSSHASPVSKDWSDEARSDLACTVFHTMRQHLGLMDPLLSLLLRYLLHTYTVYRESQTEPLPESQFVDTLLLPGRDAGPLPSEAPPQPFSERDLQSIIQAVGVPRQEALDALKHACGDALAALKALLMRMRLNTEAVDSLVQEYACYRGLLSVGDEATPGAGTSKASPPPAQPQAMDVDQERMQQQQQQQACSTSTASAPGRSCAKRSQECVAGRSAVQGAGMSDSGAHAWEAYGGRSESVSPPYKVPRWRGRQTAASWSQPMQQQQGWPGGAAAAAAGSDGPEGLHEGAAGGGSVSTGSQPAAATGSTSFSAGANAAAQGVPSQSARLPAEQNGKPAGAACEVSLQASEDASAVRLGSLHISEPGEKQAPGKAAPAAPAQKAAHRHGPAAGSQRSAFSQLQALAKAGQWQEVMALAEELQPGLLEQEPALAFELKRCEFMGLVAAGDYGAALTLARGQLTPLADKHPELQPQLKAVMGALLPGKSGAAAAADSGAALASLQRALQSKLGLPGPRLPRLLQVLLAAHKAWFKAQRCSDPFAAALRIDALRAPAPSSAVHEHAANGAAAVAYGVPDQPPAPITITPTHPFIVDESDDDDDGDGDDQGAVDEDAALRLMEILELPRSQALALLMQYDSVEAALHSVFG